MLRSQSLLEAFQNQENLSLEWSSECFGSSDFRSASSEESLSLGFLEAASVDSSLRADVVARFWLVFLKKDYWQDGENSFVAYYFSGLWLPTTEPMFEQSLKNCTSRLVTPFILLQKPRVGFRAAVRMYDEWNDAAFVVAYGVSLDNLSLSTSISDNSFLPTVPQGVLNSPDRYGR